MVEVLGLFVGILVSLSIAYWQHRVALRAGEKQRAAEQQLDMLVRDLPRQLAMEIGRLPSPVTVGQGGRFITTSADVDNDGQDELLVEFPAGAHGSGLQVFGWRDWEFVKIGELATGHASGFEVYDFDGDGRLEIGAVETDWDQGESYLTAPMLKIWYRWNGSEFAEVQRTRLLPEF
jgi:hypothetical protein